mmetsp:Transcript_31543/g.61552  ORF Transcript_31543/g.61552 Transcript_31543/m.61552 type:complete len:98 (-) Transcript_31543:322-615(-)
MVVGVKAPTDDSLATEAIPFVAVAVELGAEAFTVVDDDDDDDDDDASFVAVVLVKFAGLVAVGVTVRAASGTRLPNPGGGARVRIEAAVAAGPFGGL